MTLLGYTSEKQIAKYDLLNESWKFMGGSDERNIPKRALTIFLNAINNVYLPWMSVEKTGFHLKSDKETSQIHNKYFSFWEHKSKLKINGGSSLRMGSNHNILKLMDQNQQDSQFKPKIN